MKNAFPSLFLDIDFAQKCKFTEQICGDAFLQKKIDQDNRQIAVLSDGLASGVKANILATMTASMMLKFMENNTDIINSAGIMMSALPVCKVRKISYATFTIVESLANGEIRIIEMGNPSYILIRDNKVVTIKKETQSAPNWKNRSIEVSSFRIYPEDRIIFFSDGVSQAGLGNPEYRLGWRLKGCTEYLLKTLQSQPTISSYKLSEAVVRESMRKFIDNKNSDDITCASIYYRKPRRLRLLTGAPFNEERDSHYAELLVNFEGKTVICGGTTANIIGRELDRNINVILDRNNGSLPPMSEIEGIDMVTEGILTLTQVVNYLENGVHHHTDPAAKLALLLRESDIIEIFVGTRINEVLQDPNLPIELDIRRSIIKRAATLLKEKYVKTVTVKFI